MKNVYKHISEKMASMSKNHKKIATFILENTDTIPFLTVKQLATKVGVADSTIVRFAVFLGYSGYNELQQDIQKSAQEQLTTFDRLKISKEFYSEFKVDKIFDDDIENIKLMQKGFDDQAFEEAAQAILQGRKIYIVASRSAVSIAIFLEYYLDIMLDNVEVLDTAKISGDFLNNLNEEDVVIGIGFMRYSKITVDVFEYAKEKNAKTIAITDTMLSPLIPFSQIFLLAKTQMPSFIDSFVAPLSLINALLVFIGQKRKDTLYERLDRLEKIWNKFDIFYKMDK